MKLTALLGIAAALVAFSVACGGGDDKADTIDPPTATEGTEPEEPEATDEPVLSGNDGLDQAELQDALPELGDLPSGWVVSVDDEEDDDETDEVCGESAEEDLEPLAEAAVGFEQSEFGPFIATALMTMDDADDALDKVREGFSACTEWTVVDEDGAEITYHLSPLSFAEVGEEAFAVRMSAAIPFFGAFTGDLVYFRRGSTLASMAALSLGPVGPDTELLEELALDTDARLR